MPTYKSYCWSLGTTSFRMVEFNRKIERQLALLYEFWKLPQNADENWSSNNVLQKSYYDFIKHAGFIDDTKTAPRKDKDARQKTSGLVDLGIIDDERKLTEAGDALLSIAQSGNFSKNNILHIPADSYIYFKQLLKLSYSFDGCDIRPFAVLAYVLSEIGELTKEEFTYLLPLAINKQKTKRIIGCIKDIRANKSTINDAIASILLEMDNYKEAESILLNVAVVDDAVIKGIGMNRKSGEYDLCYSKLYKALENYRATHDQNAILLLYDAANKVSGNARLLWKTYLFNTVSRHKVETDGIRTIHGNRLILETSDEITFRKEFFKMLHLFKARSLLADYYDLNKRYFKTSDTILFQDDKVKLDIIPKCFFSLVQDSLWDIAFTKADNLNVDCDLPDIASGFAVSQEQIFAKIEDIYGVKVRNLYDVQSFVDQERYERFNAMVDTKFTDEKIIALMSAFEDRRDSDIQAMVTNNADVPTIFEYVLAIAWYKISGRQGKVLDYMNLSLDADLLPITHAAGGHEDITYKYTATESYPAHTLLIEATLAGGTNQRRMEMEPVSRHLGDYMLAHKDEEAYCVFATTFLHINVISDFRGKKNQPYYSYDGSQSVDGMKIIPLQTTEIKTIIKKHLTYTQLYTIFKQAFQSNIAPNNWYENEIKCVL